jgi:para-aminobenzoate synthetase component 1
LRPIIREIPYPQDIFGAFRALASERAPFMLDSALADDRLGRWCFIGADPFAVLTSRGANVSLLGLERDPAWHNPFAVAKGLMASFHVDREPDDPPFLGGAVGYWGYELRHFVERVPRDYVDDAPVPDCFMGFYDTVIALDRWRRRAWVIAIPAMPQRGDPNARIERMATLVADPPGHPALPTVRPKAPRPEFARHPLADHPEILSNFTRDAYVRGVRRAKEYIAAGDTFQINLSQRLSARVNESPLQLYERLRATNPAPFAAYLDCGDFAVLSASPERFLQIRGRDVETRPIKGTRPRGSTPDEDEALAQELLASEKDRAENVMIVDLERNDLGRTCAYGSVHVTELCALERYETVFHLVSTVIGRLHEGHTAVDCLKACFPGGSITGAPKVRSMEIIDELEPTCRGVYTGAIGYLCFSGDMDTNIVIRTMVVKDGWAHFQVGGGIVADSDPDAEYEETLDKARALIRVVTHPVGVVRSR